MENKVLKFRIKLLLIMGAIVSILVIIAGIVKLHSLYTIIIGTIYLAYCTVKLYNFIIIKKQFKKHGK